MILDEKTYQYHVDLAEHYIAIGMTDIHLYRRYDSQVKVTDVDLPWEHVSKIGNGGGWRHGMPIDISFTADHPSGLTFHWSFYLEPHQASGDPQFDLARLNVMLQKLPLKMYRQIQELLLVNVKRCDEMVEELRTFYIERRDKAKAFRQLVEAIVEEE